MFTWEVVKGVLCKNLQQLITILPAICEQNVTCYENETFPAEALELSHSWSCWEVSVYNDDTMMYIDLFFVLIWTKQLHML